jgi:hypothetical protein
VGVIDCDCHWPSSNFDDLELEVRRFGNGSPNGSPGYRWQCQRCGRKWGGKLDQFDLPGGISRKTVKWARDRVQKPPRPNSLKRKRAEVSQSAQFQEQRDRIFRRDDWTCQGCGLDDDREALEVHHARYPQNPEDHVPDSWLQTVCGSCNLAEREDRLHGGKGGRVGR